MLLADGDDVVGNVNAAVDGASLHDALRSAVGSVDDGRVTRRLLVCHRFDQPDVGRLAGGCRRPAALPPQRIIA
jgi:hypothetical protein